MINLKVKIGFSSTAGVKAENQDACDYYIPDGSLLEYKGIAAVIADGVSACERAKEASNGCVQGFLTDYYATSDSWGTEHSATKVVSALNNWFYSHSTRSYSVSSMLSTLSILIIKSNTAHLFHVGDSRIYRYRDGTLTQLTNDHVLSVSKEKTYLSRAIGFDLKVSLDYKTLEVKVGDCFLLTTDGVHDYLSHNELQSLIGDGINAKDLVTKAIDKNSQDNASAMICRVEQLPDKNINEAFDELTQRPIPPDLEQGMKINGFVIQSLIKSSSKVQIYIAKDIHTSKLVVLKTPSVNFEDDPHYLKHFMYEEWAGQRIHSSNVVKIHSSAQKSKFLAYAMEYIKGQTLRQWMNDNPRPEMDIVIGFVKQIIQGMRAFHRQEMLHCDLKPENIMLDELGQVKLIDFGSTRIAGVEELINPINYINNQGTKGYTAPEVILKNQLTKFSDQFSLGVIVYEMLAGKLPYAGKLNKNLSVNKLAKIEYESILECDPLVPIWIDGAIHKACNLNIGNRYEMLSEFLFDLENPKSEFLQVTQNSNNFEFVVNKFRVLTALLFALNIFLLLMLIK